MEAKTVQLRSAPAEVERFSLRNGWRAGISRGIVLIALTFIVNLVCTIYAVLRTSSNVSYGQKNVFVGDCDRAKRWDTYLHLLINILSTIVLGVSNYTMQCLSAPTREEVDEAHRQRMWLDIGVLSFRNLRMINRKRVMLWTLLGLSSLPFHLFYNSAMYSSIYSADYAVFMTTEDYLVTNATSHTLGIDTTDTQPNTSGFSPSHNLWDHNSYFMDIYSIVDLSSRLYASAVGKSLTRRNTTDCMDRYASTFPTNQGSLILVTSNATNVPRMYGYWATEPLRNDFSDGCPPDAFPWICNEISMSHQTCNQRQTCSQKRSQLDPDNWRPLGNKVDYCLTQDFDQKCTLSLNLPVIIVVLAVSVIKVVLLFWAQRIINNNPLMTMGDAVASFLERNDNTTKGMSWMGKCDLGEWENSISQAYSPVTKTAHTSHFRWNSVVGVSRWLFLLALFTLLLGICFALFLHGILGRAASAATLIRLSLGDVDPLTFIQGWRVPSIGVSGLLSNTFVANSPQLILSMVYFVYNTLLTTFLLGSEWNAFSSRPKGLRVSEHPVGRQRATHFLQLPLRWALPLMTLSAVLHWLCSQSIFLVSIEFDHSIYPERDWKGTLNDGCVSSLLGWGGSTGSCYEQYFTCAYSPLAMLLTILLGIGMIVFAVLVGLRRFDNRGMPVVGSCSAAISASCHIPDQDEIDSGNKFGGRAATSVLKWAKFDTRLTTIELVQVVGNEAKEHTEVRQYMFHCGFTPQELSLPDEDDLYA